MALLAETNYTMPRTNGERATVIGATLHLQSCSQSLGDAGWKASKSNEAKGDQSPNI